MTEDQKAPENPRFLSREDRAAVTARAVAAAKTVAESYGLKVEDPEVLADAYAVRVHLRPAPVVARVSTFTALLREPIETWLARELSVVGFLAARGAPVVPPSDALPPGPHQHDGLHISFWRYVQPVSDSPPAPEVTGKMLSELHDVMREYPGELPLLAPPFNDIPRGLARLERIGNVLPAEDLAMLKERADHLLPRLQRLTDPLQPLHGDAHGNNLIPTRQGLLWNDFEDTCLGPIAWDVSSLAFADSDAAAAYPNAPDPATLELYRQVRLLHGVVWVFALLPEFSEWAEPARAMLEQIREQG